MEVGVGKMTDIRHGIKDLINRNVPKGSSILDMGAGYGDMAKLLYKDYKVDGVEAWAPYIEEFKLTEIYNSIIVKDVLEYLPEPGNYSTILALELVEHLPVDQAHNWLQELLKRTNQLIVSVPYLYPQGEVHGNKWQIHIQDDLTEDIFKQRYPFMYHYQNHYLHAGFYGGLFISNNTWK